MEKFKKKIRKLVKPNIERNILLVHNCVIIRCWIGQRPSETAPENG